ncbi:MAG: hypothetical protein NVS9B4_05030 [Candidatus Acidiferrum sp.]
MAPFGPGYSIAKQELRVRFEPAPEPRIFVEGEYQLKNTGNQPLSSIELRLPGKRRFHFAKPGAKWDSSEIALGVSPSNARNMLLKFPRPWEVSATHTLRLSIELSPAAPPNAATQLSFTPDAFFLPAQGWGPELLTARGIFATGGVPPKKWKLDVNVPDEFAIRTSENKQKTSHGHGQITVQAVQAPRDRYPFVVAGRYIDSEIAAGQRKIHFWTRQTQDPTRLQEASEVLVHAMEAYNATFGSRVKSDQPLWLVECPVVTGCFTNLTAVTAQLLGEEKPTAAEMASMDTVMVDLTAGLSQLAASAAPSLAASWMGYGQSPGFFEQQAPLSAFPAFAAAVGREAVDGPGAREATIRRVLATVPASVERRPDDETILRIKSFLFFYALQDRYGREVFRKALRHLFSARAGGGFDLDDLIASFSAESHQNAAEFVRLWMKHPGVPADFRARYENASATISSKEATP